MCNVEWFIFFSLTQNIFISFIHLLVYWYAWLCCADTYMDIIGWVALKTKTFLFMLNIQIKTIYTAWPTLLIIEELFQKLFRSSWQHGKSWISFPQVFPWIFQSDFVRYKWKTKFSRKHITKWERWKTQQLFIISIHSIFFILGRFCKASAFSTPSTKIQWNENSNRVCSL